MARALQLAKLGQGKVMPNPMVGCVIVHPEKGIIGEGYHQEFGKAHAEVNASQSVADQELLQRSTLYVTLEPCSHFGKTPPCADLIIDKKIPKVVVCNSDPNPLVAGKGFEKLRSAGIEVLTGILENEGFELNKKFFVSQNLNRPFVTLKWAQTADGFIAREDGSSKWISSEESRLWVHKLRSEHQAIFAGRTTIRTDNPFLKVKDWSGPNPIRIIFDPNLSLNPDLNIFKDDGSSTWVLNQFKEDQVGNILFFSDFSPNKGLEDVLQFLWQKGIHSLFVEGGSFILNDLIKKNLWDEAIVFTSPVLFQKGLKAPDPFNGKLVANRTIGFDQMSTWIPM